MSGGTKTQEVRPSNRCDLCGRFRRGGLYGFMMHEAYCPSRKMWIIGENGDFKSISMKEYKKSQ